MNRPLRSLLSAGLPLAAAPLAALLPLAALAATPSTPAGGPPVAPAEAAPQLRSQSVRPLPGRLDAVPLINDNNPELIRAPGVLLSTFAGTGRGVPEAHLDVPLSGRFDLFSHHVYAGKPESLDSTLWLAVVAAPRQAQAVRLNLLSGSTALSQSLDASQPAAPFLPLPDLLPQGTTPIYAGPGSRVAGELLQRQRSSLFPSQWTLEPGRLTVLAVLPLPVRGLDPLLNGRNLQWRLQSDGAVDVATLAAFGENDRPPEAATWEKLLNGPLSPREHAPTPRGQKGGIVYSRVSGVQEGSAWRTRITDPHSAFLSVRQAPVSWPIASLERGTLGTGQVQTAELRAFYPGTAWAAHGNYGVEYDLTLPLRNDTSQPVQLQLALESPIKADQPQGGLRFRSTPSRAVMFRGAVEVRGLDNDQGRASGLRRFHLVQRAGQAGPALGTISLAPGQVRQLQVRLIYPADATPPQVLSLLPVEPQAGAGPGAAVQPPGGR
ncbi:MAG: DUF3370 domain-containing protein [Prochlorococcaceae cyanobacterium]|jgi:hypothetical protein